MRKVFFILYSLLNLIFIVSCASTNKEEKAFSEAEAINSIGAYTSFCQKFPNGKFTEEAKKRASSSDREALINTCRLGTIGAFQGFMESYPTSKYSSLTHARIDFLKAANLGNLEAYMQFITRYPNNPFVPEARVSYPILWLDKIRGKVGVIINVGEFVSWKGVFGGMRVTRDEVRQDTFDKLQEEVGRIGIHVTLLDSPEDAKSKKIPVILVMNYSEKGEIDESLAEAIRSLLKGPPSNVSITMTIKDAKNGFEYYSNISNLKTKIDRIVAMKALCGFRKESALASLMVALYDKDPYIQNSAAEALKEVTGQDFKEDRGKWSELWERENL